MKSGRMSLGLEQLIRLTNWDPALSTFLKLVQ